MQPEWVWTEDMKRMADWGRGCLHCCCRPGGPYGSSDFCDFLARGVWENCRGQQESGRPWTLGHCVASVWPSLEELEKAPLSMRFRPLWVLDRRFRAKLERVVEDVRGWLGEHPAVRYEGVGLGIMETVRSARRGRMLKEKGSSKTGAQSRHCPAAHGRVLAADLAPLLRGKWNYGVLDEELKAAVLSAKRAHGVNAPSDAWDPLHCEDRC